MNASLLAIVHIIGGYKCLAPNDRVYISEDVQFNEYKFSYNSMFHSPCPNNNTPCPSAIPSALIQSSNSLDSSPLTTSHDFVTHDFTRSLSQSFQVLAKPTTISEGTATALVSMDTTMRTSQFVSSIDIETSLPHSTGTVHSLPQLTNTQSMITQSKDGIFKPKVLLTHTTPTSIKQALTDTNWLAAMKEEY